MPWLRWVPLGVLLAMPAWASVETDLAEIGASTSDLVEAANALDHQVAPGRAHMSREDAIIAFEDNLYLLLIGKYRPAAEGFFGLVTTGALQDPGLHRDAEWHLAESLYGMGNIVTAEARFRLIAEDPQHAFRADAVRRLLEIYAETNDAKRFYEVYESEVVQGRVKPTPLITYTVARSFYKQSEFDKATSYFTDVPEGSSHHSRARYFLGVMAVRGNRLADAERFFQESADDSVESPEQRKTHDLALLALARLAYEREDYVVSTDFYQQIAGDSDYLADVLYETVWTFIKQDHFDEALQAVELFLLAFPEHQYTGELKVVEGHLHMGCGQDTSRCRNLSLIDSDEGDSYDRALASYEAIVLDYAPIRDHFGDIQSKPDEPKRYFDEVLVAGDKSLASDIPDFALAMMRDDVALSAAIELHQALLQEQKDLEECETMINELEVVLSSDASLGGYQRARYKAMVSQTRAVQQQVALLAIEAAWLDREGANVSRYASELANIGELASRAGNRIQEASEAKDAHDKRLAELRTEISGIEAAVLSAETTLDNLRTLLAGDAVISEEDRARYSSESEQVEASLAADRKQLGELRVELSAMKPPDDGGASGSEDELVADITSLRKSYEALRPDPNAATARRIDELHEQLSDAGVRFEAVRGRLAGLAGSEIGRIRERFEAEVVEVSSERRDLEDYSVGADSVAISLTREGLQRMQTFFAESVVKADLGIIDVYWARKLEIADERERVQKDRNMMVAELNRRFELIRQKMEQ